MGIGDWGLGIGDWAQSPIPNPQSPEVVQDISECFQRQVLELEEANMKPAFTIENVHYCWIKHQNIYSTKI
jgi:hypothetical protein